MKVEEIRNFKIDIESFPDPFLELYKQKRVHAEIEKAYICLHIRLPQQGGYDFGNLAVNLSALCLQAVFCTARLFFS
ncbi:hypothetical protein D3C81_1796790 [compost metagenome]